jgi:glycine cleavage system H protein
MAEQTAAEAALAARRQRMAGRWFTPEHGWMAISGEIATVGLTDYAAQGLRDIVYVSLPVVGATVTAGDLCGQVESTKAISDLYSPIDGEVTEVNGELATKPRLINKEPFGAGWMYRVRLAAADGEAALRSSLLSPAEYEELTKGVG